QGRCTAVGLPVDECHAARVPALESRAVNSAEAETRAAEMGGVLAMRAVFEGQEYRLSIDELPAFLDFVAKRRAMRNEELQQQQEAVRRMERISRSLLGNNPRRR